MGHNGMQAALVSLPENVHLGSLQQQERFKNLDDKLQKMIIYLAAGPKRLNELTTVLCSEANLIKGHITSEFQQQRRCEAHEAYIKTYLESLRLPDITTGRKETIKQAHTKTFQWIFETEDTRDKVHKWDNFSQWLKKGQDTYWINGKAGSGKSTLMNFIYEDDRTHEALEVWSGIKRLFTPSFFFWNAGSKMEKSAEGLLRSLLYQVLEQFPHRTPTTGRSLQEPEFAGRSDYGPSPAWTELRLRTTLHDVMLGMQDECRICIFIDGLDEFDGDQTTLISTIRELQCPYIKICLSSRWSRPFSAAFACGAGLQLQDLTAGDIEAFVTTRLQDARPAISADDVTSFLNTIVYKAAGVFLWVDLVVSHLLRGIGNEDSISILRTRLEHMPPDVEDLYTHMLKNIEGVYREDATKLFKMTLVGLEGTLLNVSLALYDAFDQTPELTIEQAINYCELTKRRIPTICAGLLEIHVDDRKPNYGDPYWGEDAPYVSMPVDPNISSDLAKVSSYERLYRVDFFHRSTVDFFRENEEGKRLVETHASFDCNPFSLYVKALLAKVRLLGLPSVPTNKSVPSHESAGLTADLQYFRAKTESSEEELHRAFVNEVMDKLVLAEVCSGTAQVSLCEAVNRTLELIHQRQICRCDNLHWCMLWGFQETRAYCDPRYEQIEMRTSGSQPSSTVSIHTAFGDQNHGDLEVLSTEPVDFLGLACSWGLAHYVQEALTSRVGANDPKKRTNLLCCCMRAFRPHRNYYRYGGGWDTDHARWLGPLHLVGELLKHGADPNCYVKDFETTIWGQFLKRLKEFLPVDPSWCAKVIHVFVENGADLHESVNIRKTYQLSHLSLREPGILDNSGGWQAFSTRHKVTTLYLFQQFLTGVPGFETLEEKCIAKGIRSSSSCTDIQVRSNEQSFISSLGPYRMTNAQYHKFEAAINGYRSKKYTSGSMTRLECARQIVQLWKEVENNAREPDMQNASDEDRISDDTDGFYSARSRISDEDIISDNTDDFHSASSRISLSGWRKWEIAQEAAGYRQQRRESGVGSYPPHQIR